jgi:hypothetical protein
MTMISQSHHTEEQVENNATNLEPSIQEGCEQIAKSQAAMFSEHLTAIKL